MKNLQLSLRLNQLKFVQFFGLKADRQRRISFFKMNNLSLTEFFKKYGKNTTNNFQLLHYAKQLKIPNFQILMRNEIKNANMKLPVNIITNIHTSKENGIHWSCFHIDEKNNKFWFDSYGIPPPKEIIDKFKSPITASDFKLQELGIDNFCGQISLYVLYKLNNKTDFLKTLLDIHEVIRT